MNMSKKIICICLCIVLILLMIYLVNLRNDKNSNDNLIISNNVPNINAKIINNTIIDITSTLNDIPLSFDFSFINTSSFLFFI